MKNINRYPLFYLLTFVLFSVNAQSLFDDSLLHEIRITSTETDFWQILDDEFVDFLDNGTEIPYHSVTVEIDGNTLENVGIRQKGYSSNFFTTTTKKPLKLNFGKFVDGQRYDNVKKLNLANGIGDPAIIKDKMAYNMFRQHGVPSPRVAHTKVYINDELWGVYGMIEQIDKRYLKRNFADKTGNLWKNKENSTLSWSGTSPDNYTFELQTNDDENDWTKFIEFIDFLNNTSDVDFQNGLEAIFDLDEYLRILAIDILINNWDSYIDHGRNWYLYFEPKTNKMHWLPWDYNFSFDRDQFGTGDFPILLNDIDKILIKRILEVPEFRIRYLNYMCEIIEVNFTETRLTPMLDAQVNLVEDDWNTATNNFFFLNDIQDEIDGDTWNGALGISMAQGLKKFIQDKTIVIADAISNQNYTCTPLDLPINSQDVVINEFMADNMDGSPWSDQDNENDDWVELYNNTDNDISLKNYFLSDSQSFLHKWEFPEDAIILANDYLIVWADKDPQQVGLHTKFNLDKDGDELFLSYLDGTLIDSVDFPDEQAENKSLSRLPNGTGNFFVGDVTFNAENTGEGVGLNDFEIQGITIYPNPAVSTLKIDFTSTVASKIVIHDILGSVIYEANNNQENVNVDLSNWNTGVYFVRLISEKYNVSRKIIVQ